MKPLFIASNTAYSGKMFVALGLGLSLKDQGYDVGFMKPLGKLPVKKGEDVFDEEALLVREFLDLSDPPEVVSPFVFDYKMQTALLDGTIGDVKKKVMEAFRSLSGKDIVIVVGPHDLFEGALMNIKALDLVKEMEARVLLVEQWRGHFSMDSLFGTCQLMKERFIGGVINKVPDAVFPHVRDRVRPFLKNSGLRIFGVFQKDKVLQSITVRHIIEVIKGGVLCAEDRLDEFVENFLIGAMDVDTATSYFVRTPDKAVITGAHRTDIQIVAMETSTKCIILTGGSHPNEMVVEKARSKGIPLICAPGDTFATAEKIESIMGRSIIKEKRKAERARELVNKEFDMEGFLRALFSGAPRFSSQK